MLILGSLRSADVRMVVDPHRSLDRAMNPLVTSVDVVHMESVFLSETRLWKSFLHASISLKAHFNKTTSNIEIQDSPDNISALGFEVL